MMSSTPLYLYHLTLTFVLSCVTSQIYLPCDVTLVPGCYCSNPEAPIVNCSHLNLTWIPRVPSDASHIHTLDLSHNQLTFVPAGVLSAATGLRSLILAHNQIRSIHRHAFQGKEQTLHHLDLSYNNLSFVPPQLGDMRGSRHWRLSTLDLGHNRIRAVDNFAFYNLDKLKELDMAGNPLSRIAEYGWDYMRSLKRLSVSFGRYAQFYVTFIPTYGIEQIEALSISRAAPQFMAVIHTWLVKFTRLKELRLDSMKLNDHHLTENSLYNLSSTLHSLSLSNNHLKHIPGSTLVSLTSLYSLDLSGNHIGKFGTKKEWQVPVQIRELDLSGNRLRKVNPAALSRLKHARKIDLSQNRLSSVNLSPHSIRSLPRHLKLYVGENPLRCNCANAGLKSLITREISRSNGHLHRGEIRNEIRCAPGGRYGSQRLLDVPESQFECKREKPLRKITRKPEQDVLKGSNMKQRPSSKISKFGSHLNKPMFDRKRLMRLEKPITSIYFNKNIHSYLASEANVDIPDEIAELLDIRRTALR